MNLITATIYSALDLCVASSVTTAIRPADTTDTEPEDLHKSGDSIMARRAMVSLLFACLALSVSAAPGMYSACHGLFVTCFKAACVLL